MQVTCAENQRTRISQPYLTLLPCYTITISSIQHDRGVYGQPRSSAASSEPGRRTSAFAEKPETSGAVCKKQGSPQMADVRSQQCRHQGREDHMFKRTAITVAATEDSLSCHTGTRIKVRRWFCCQALLQPLATLRHLIKKTHQKDASNFHRNMPVNMAWPYTDASAWVPGDWSRARGPVQT